VFLMWCFKQLSYGEVLMPRGTLYLVPDLWSCRHNGRIRFYSGNIQKRLAGRTKLTTGMAVGH